MNSNPARKKFIIITGYFANEHYGLLGPQMAATIIQENSSYDCIVLAVDNQYNKKNLLKTISDYFIKNGPVQRPVIGFSTLGGRQDLVDLAGDLKKLGALTLLAGPQAGVDFTGELKSDEFPHRFKGFSNFFNFALQGPAEQILPFLDSDIDNMNFDCPDLNYPGFIYKDRAGKILATPPSSFNSRYLSRVNWSNIHILKGGKLIPLKVLSAQIIQQIGCPYASLSKKVEIEHPDFLKSEQSRVEISVKGCSFCDVAADKGYMGTLPVKAVNEQLQMLPMQNNKKIPFELINETPITKLESLMKSSYSLKVNLSRINLTLRADHLIANFDKFKNILKLARKEKIKILVSSIGFESFDNTILKNLNKGVTTEINIKAVKKLRMLEYEFKDTFYYSRNDGANHGFIHPTPWDNKQTEGKINTEIKKYGLDGDILPGHSTPLIIHHACALGDWARKIELDHGVKFLRHGSTIGWWQVDGKVVI